MGATSTLREDTSRRSELCYRSVCEQTWSDNGIILGGALIGEIIHSLESFEMKAQQRTIRVVHYWILARRKLPTDLFFYHTNYSQTSISNRSPTTINRRLSFAIRWRAVRKCPLNSKCGCTWPPSLPLSRANNALCQSE
jgi:hypothetical protein